MQNAEHWPDKGGGGAVFHAGSSYPNHGGIGHGAIANQSASLLTSSQLTLHPKLPRLLPLPFRRGEKATKATKIRHDDGVMTSAPHQ